jgi:hypothetical protein
MTWLRVCEHVVSPYVEEKDVKDAVKVAAQTYYGRLLAVNAICELVTSQFVGVASDKHGRRPVQVAAQLGQVPWMQITAGTLQAEGVTRSKLSKFGDIMLGDSTC